jgi:hypothetical protein
MLDTLEAGKKVEAAVRIGKPFREVGKPYGDLGHPKLFGEQITGFD